MQLQLKQAGVTANQDIEVFLILNPQPSNMDFSKVASPSLSELIEHDSGDTLEGGTVVYALKVSTGSTEIDLSELLELGNSILGGDSIFPAGSRLVDCCCSATKLFGYLTKIHRLEFQEKFPGLNHKLNMNLIRKIAVGPDYKNAMHYEVGQNVIKGKYKIHSIEEQSEGYIVRIVQDNVVVDWKKVNLQMPVHIEYNIIYD